jgi:uncharacterized membrane protein
VEAQELTPAVEREIAVHIAKHGAVAAPLIIAAATALRGWNGLTSSAIGVAIVIVNFLVAAAIMTRAARSGPAAIGGAAAGGYIARLAIIVIALVALRHRSWIDLPTLGVVIVGTHIGLLFYEMKFLSITLAAPGLRPVRPGSLGDR